MIEKQVSLEVFLPPMIVTLIQIDVMHQRLIKIHKKNSETDS